VTSEHVAGIAVRNRQMLDFAHNYRLTTPTCVGRSGEQGVAGNAIKIAKADLVPTEANLLPKYASFIELQQACTEFVNRSIPARIEPPDDGVRTRPVLGLRNMFATLQLGGCVFQADVGVVGTQTVYTDTGHHGYKIPKAGGGFAVCCPSRPRKRNPPRHYSAVRSPALQRTLRALMHLDVHNVAVPPAAQ
jgi:hypothetical protein